MKRSDIMHPHELDVQINNLEKTDNYKKSEFILYELTDYSGKITDNQLYKIYNAALTNEEIYSSNTCREYLKLILNKNKENIDEHQYQNILNKLND